MSDQSVYSAEISKLMQLIESKADAGAVTALQELTDTIRNDLSRKSFDGVTAENPAAVKEAAAADFIKATEHSVGVPAEGGYTINTTYDTELTEQIKKTGSLYGSVKVYRDPTNRVRTFKFRGGPARTRAEKEAYGNPNTVDTFAQQQFGMTDVYDIQRQSVWVQEGGSFIPLANLIIESIAYNMAEKVDDLIYNGTVANTVRGIDGVTSTNMGLLTLDKVTAVDAFTNEFGKLAVHTEALAASGQPAIHLEDAVINAQTKLASRYLSNATLVVSRDFEAKALTARDTQGRRLIQSVAGVAPGVLAGGMSYIRSDYLASLEESADTGALAALMGDLSQYHVVEYGPISWIKDEITDPRFTKYTARQRLGGGLVDFQAVRGIAFGDA